MSYLLAIDSGNSFIKWGLHDGQNWLVLDKVSHGKIDSLAQVWQNLQEPSAVIVSHVAGIRIRNKLSLLLSNWATVPQWITAIPHQCGVNNGYSLPAQLGCDRWAALIAGWHLTQHACLVINVGTAMTVDALSDSGDFLGGTITPGPDLMMRILEHKTTMHHLDAGEFKDFPVCTADSVHSGIVQALLGAIERARNKLCSTLDHPVGSCIISGGGAPVLLPHINFPFKFIDSLVLEGLVIIACDSSQC